MANKTIENAADRVRAMFELSKSLGKCHTQKEFAALLGVNAAVLSTFLNNSAPITDQMYRRIENAAAVKGISLADGVVSSGSANVIAGRDQKILGSDDTRWFNLVAEKDKQIDRLLCIIENMQK